jgi:hypothetical protein
MKPSSQRFLATIYRIWMMRHVDVPEEVSRALAKQLQSRDPAGTKGKARAKTRAEAANPKYIPVVAIVNGRSARVTLTPAGGGRYRVQLNTALRKAACADVGDAVSVELRLDLASRERPVPVDLRAALKGHPKARRAFEELTTSHRRHLIEWFDSAKGTEARIRRLGRAIDVLLERALLSRSKTSHGRRK